MDINTLRGIISAIVLIVFIGIVLWAYSSRRKKDFDEAANLPLQDNRPSASQEKSEENRHE